MVTSLDVFVSFTTETGVRSLGLFVLVLFILSFCLLVFIHTAPLQPGMKSLDISPLYQYVLFSKKNVQNFVYSI